MIHVRIFHGSVTKPFSGDTHRELGGWFGGHVAVQVFDRVYGFYYADRNNIHIFPKNQAKSAIFQNQSLPEWEEIVRQKKETIVSIPASEEEQLWLKDYYERNVADPECDYSFWGERCASNCHRLLSEMQKIALHLTPDSNSNAEHARASCRSRSQSLIHPRTLSR